MKLALLGYGFMGGAHLAAMQRIEDVEVAAVATRTRPSADAPAKGNLDLKSGPLPDSVRWVSDWREILADPSIDAVDVCLPTDLHREVVLAALHAGKHVLCEKPMALTFHDCRAMMLAAQGAGLTFMVGQVLRFMFPYQHAADFVQQHFAGLSRCVLQRSTGYPQWGGWLADAARSGGAILDLLSHDLDQALRLFGVPSTVVATSLGEVDTARCLLRYPGGLEVVVEGGWFTPEVEFSASFEFHAGAHSLVFREGVLRETNAGAERVVDQPEQDAYFDEVAYFVDCCRRGVQPDLCPPAASADAVHLSNLLKASREANGRELPWRS
ncbi:MAG: Gfo/Idh/MocA family protein [Janthinobacterium lividum]